MILSWWKDMFQTAQAAAMTMGVLGGLWWFFVRRRTKLRANLVQSVAHHHLDDERVLVRVTVTIENRGELAMQIRTFSTYVYIPPDEETLASVAVLPEDQRMCSWTLIHSQMCGWPGKWAFWAWCRRQPTEDPDSIKWVEPGETDVVAVDLVLPRSVTLIQVRSHLKNERSTPKLDWTATTLYAIENSTEKQEEESMSSSLGNNNESKSSSTNSTKLVAGPATPFQERGQPVITITTPSSSPQGSSGSTGGAGGQKG